MENDRRRGYERKNSENFPENSNPKGKAYREFHQNFTIFMADSERNLVEYGIGGSVDDGFLFSEIPSKY